MLKTVSSLLLTFAVLPAMAAAEGYVMGTANAKDGQTGAILLGNASSTYYGEQAIQVGFTNKSTKTVLMNPMPFYFQAADEASLQAMNTSTTQHATVVLHFSEPMFAQQYYNAPNLVDHVMPVDPSIPAEVCTAHPKTHLPIKGSVSGRIVRLSLEGYRDPVNSSVSWARGMMGYAKENSVGIFLKVWEATIQVGDSGNNFFHVTITDSKMFDCLLKSLEANRPAKFSFAEVKHPATLQYVNDLETVEPLN